ncbi:MAG: hypothetical protein D6814_05760 [Calditrichaeota bacterium]|nr:MAG: hypothetical protein D6814_05760 [Calditrichota bacterium]
MSAKKFNCLAKVHDEISYGMWQNMSGSCGAAHAGRRKSMLLRSTATLSFAGWEAPRRKIINLDNQGFI